MSAKRGLIASIPLVVLVATIHAGGWAIYTVRDLPEYGVAGTSLPLTFMVRQHGLTPLAGLTPALTAKSGTDKVMTKAVATQTAGEYSATLLLPRPGKWTIEFEAPLPLGPALPALTVIAPGQPSPRPLSPASRGERLFVAKGCIGCHVNREVQAETLVEVGPDLTRRRFPETYLRRVLADPQTTFTRERVTDEDLNQMPNLELKEFEISALVAFINRERPR